MRKILPPTPSEGGGVKKKIYIAGKVTGEPISECTMKFGAAQVDLERLGHTAVNPLAVVGDWKCPWDLAMRKCIRALMDCEMIFMLEDYKNSKGAMVEYELATMLGMEIIYESSGFKRTKVY